MNDKLKEKLKFNIAIFQMKEEEKLAMNNKKMKFSKGIGVVACLVIATTGVVFASSKVIENIWKTPDKVEVPKDGIIKITEESKKENITEERAKEIAVIKLKEIGFNSDIVGTNHYKLIDSNKIMYRFKTKDNFSISIDGLTGSFFEIWKDNLVFFDVGLNVQR